jgi:hypothetical protein
MLFGIYQFCYNYKQLSSCISSQVTATSAQSRRIKEGGAKIRVRIQKRSVGIG